MERTTCSYAAHQAALLGEDLLARHRTADAEQAFAIALRADPDNVRLVMGMADVLWEGGEIERAHGWYRRAVELNPGLAPAHNGLGLTAANLDQAEAAFRMALEFDPDSAVYLANAAWALYHLGVRGEAVAGFMEIIEREPEDLGYAQALASILSEDGHVREAEYTLRAALYTVDNKPDLDEQAWYMYRLRAFDQAEKLLRRKYSYDFEMAAVFAMHGRLAMDAGMPKIAVVSFKRAVALSPRSERFHRDLAGALVAAGEPLVADAARTRAKQMRRARRRSAEDLAAWAGGELRRARAETGDIAPRIRLASAAA